MRKLTLLLTLFATLAISMLASPIDPTSARKIAERAMKENGGSLRSSEPLKLVHTHYFGSPALRSSESSQAYYYIFNRGTNAGFVIVAGDDLMPEVLGFSDKGGINPERINPNLTYWLNTYTAATEYAIKHNVDMRLSHSYDLRAETDITPLVQSRWGQDEPYNLQTPMVRSDFGKKNGYTGCVATAISQIMRYHSWPDVGEGTHSYTEYRGGTDGNIGHTTTFDTHYDWANMLYTYNNNSTSTQRNAVAKLMADVGMAINMVYYRNSSGTTSEHVLRALRQNFKYRKDVKILFRSSTPLEAFTQAIINDLRAGRPVYYAGGSSSEGGGHAFICDGYQANTNQFHFNWGWGGNEDGYFALTKLNPGSGGIGGGGYSFNDEQEVIVGISPAKTDADKAIAEAVPEMIGIISLRKYSPESKTATVRSYIYTSNSYTIPAYTGLGLYKDGTLQEVYGVIHRYVNYLGIAQNGQGLDFQRQTNQVDLSKLPDGDYVLAPICSQTSDKKADLKAAAMMRQTIGRISVKVAGGTITVSEDTDAIGNFELLPNGIATSEKLQAFDNKGFIELKLKNKSSVPFYGYVTLGLQDVNNAAKVFYTEGKVMASIDPNKDGSIRFEFSAETNFSKGLGIRVPAPQGTYRPILVYSITDRQNDNPMLLHQHDYLIPTDQTITINAPETPAQNVLVFSREDGSTQRPSMQYPPTVRMSIDNAGTNAIKNMYILSRYEWEGRLKAYDTKKIDNLDAGAQMEYTADFSNRRMDQPGVYTIVFRICRSAGSGSLNPETTGYTFGRTRYSIIAFGKDTNDSFDIVSSEQVLEQENDQLKIYPVPANTNLCIGITEGMREVRIFDASGRIVLQKTLSNNGAGTQTIAVDSLPVGLYVVQATYANGKARTMRISIER